MIKKSQKIFDALLEWSENIPYSDVVINFEDSFYPDKNKMFIVSQTANLVARDLRSKLAEYLLVKHKEQARGLDRDE